MADENRTEHPTARRITEARKKGQVVRSQDLAIAAASVAATIALGGLGGRLLTGLGNRLAADLSHVGDAPLRTLTAGELTAVVVDGGRLIAMLVGPIAVTTMLAGVAVQTLQGGFNFAPEALRLDFSKLNPVNGLQRLAPSKAGLDTLKTMVAVGMIGWIGWRAVSVLMLESGGLPWMTPLAAAVTAWDRFESFLWRVSIGLAFLAMGDYALQRHRFIVSLRMTKQEVKDEAKMNENPEIKGRVRRVQREMARRRMMADVPKATVVITNPTHFAVALEYRRGDMPAPRVLAMGQDHLALQIREKARSLGIPIVENKPLAQALYKTAEVGETIPAPLFSAVAEVLAQLIRLKQLVL